MTSLLRDLSDPSIDMVNVVSEINRSSSAIQDACFAKIAKMLKDGGPDQRRRGAELASQLKMPVAYVPVLAHALADQDDHVRFGAAWALVRLGSDAVGALGELFERFEDESIPVRDRAAWAVSNLGASAVELLLTGTGSPHVRTRAISLHCLAGIIRIPRDRAVAIADAEAQALSPTLLMSVTDPEAWVRFCAVAALESLHQRFVVPAMIELMSSPENSIREQAALQLSWTSPRLSEEAIAVLEKSLQDSSSIVRSLAEYGLRRKGRLDKNVDEMQ